MAGTLRALRRRIRSTQSTKKIFSAQELIAGARIVRAQARVEASKPYAREITRVLSALASSASLDHPLLTERQNPQRAAVLVITSDRGFAGSYNVNVLRRTEELLSLLRQEGKEPVLYVVGRKGETYYSFRDRDDGRDLHRLLRAAALRERPGGRVRRSSTSSPPVRTTRRAAPAPTASSAWTSCTSSTPSSARCSPRCPSPSGWHRWRSRRSRSSTTSARTGSTVRPTGDSGVPTSYEFEPSAEGLLDALLPKYITTRIYAAMLEAAASESASRRRAMKSASDNAEELAKNLSRQANQARQAEITQEISEIVGGSDALAAGAGD